MNRTLPTTRAVQHDVMLRWIAHETKRWAGLGVFREHPTDEAVYSLPMRSYARREQQPASLRSGAIYTLARVA